MEPFCAAFSAVTAQGGHDIVCDPLFDQIITRLIRPSSKRSFARKSSRHSLDRVPVPTEITRSLMLGGQFGPQATNLTRISIGDLKKHCLLHFLQRRSGIVAH
jgi:hypothetical protein